MLKPKESENGKSEVEIPETTQEAPETESITEADAVGIGLSKGEVDAAKRHGLLETTVAGHEEAGKKKPVTEPVTDVHSDGGASLNGANHKGTDETGTKGEGDEKEEEKPKPAEVLDQNLDPEKENEAIKDFNQNERALYWRMKKEKIKRQASDADREQTAIKLKVAEEEREALRRENEDLKKKKTKTDDLGLEGEAEVDPEDKPLTVRDLEEREKKKQEESTKEQEVLRERAKKLSVAQETLEIDAKVRYTDFEDRAEKAAEIVAAVANKTIDKLFPDPRERSRVTRKAQDLMDALRRADEYQEGEFNPADMAYELGLLHPKAEKTSTTTNGKSGKDQALSPEEIDRIARRRTSSAAFTGGGGKRVVSYDQLSMQDLAALPPEKYRQIPKDIRERILKENNVAA